MMDITAHTLESFKPTYKRWFEALAEQSKDLVIEESGFTNKEWEKIVSHEVISNYHKELVKGASKKGTLVERLDKTILDSIPKLEDIINTGDPTDVIDAVKAVMKLRSDLQEKEDSSKNNAPAVVINLTRPLTIQELQDITDKTIDNDNTINI